MCEQGKGASQVGAAQLLASICTKPASSRPSKVRKLAEKREPRPGKEVHLKAENQQGQGQAWMDVDRRRGEAEYRGSQRGKPNGFG